VLAGEPQPQHLAAPEERVRPVQQEVEAVIAQALAFHRRWESKERQQQERECS
jgi:hypothetical protein